MFFKDRPMITMGKRLSLLLIVTGFFLQSCDKLEAPYAEVKKIASDTARRAVLLEDYTGHKCTNCAPAASTAHTLEKGYEGQVFVVAIHAGNFAEPDTSHGQPFKEDFRCETGNLWYSNTAFKIDANPKGMVNRVPFKTKMSFGPSQWTDAVGVQAKLQKAAVMSIGNSYDGTTRKLSTRIDSRFLISNPGTYNLVVLIQEDSIIGAQANAIPPDSTPIIYHYVFMDVLRGSINGAYGEILTASIDITKVITKTYTFTLDPAWVPEHCKVTAFIANNETYEVMHAARKKVIEK